MKIVDKRTLGLLFFLIIVGLVWGYLAILRQASTLEKRIEATEKWIEVIKIDMENTQASLQNQMDLIGVLSKTRSRTVNDQDLTELRLGQVEIQLEELKRKLNKR